GWSDLGTWKSLYELSKKNQDKNVISGTTIVHETKNSIIKTPKDKLVVVKGLDNYIVAEFDGILMICPKDDEQLVKDFVNEAKIKFEGRFS
ncbi:MAG: mannose-1-phosphate guanylyltransferase, partial [Cytophagales bacterium]